MGFNSTVVILNDRLHEIENDPHFGKKLCDAIRAHGVPERSRPYVTGQTQVVCVQHADTMQVIAVGANEGHVLGFGFWKMSNDDLIKHLNRQRLQRQRDAKAKP